MKILNFKIPKFFKFFLKFKKVPTFMAIQLQYYCNNQDIIKKIDLIDEFTSWMERTKNIQVSIHFYYPMHSNHIESKDKYFLEGNDPCEGTLTVATLLSDDSKKRSNDHTDCSLTMIVHKSTIIANFISNDISTRVESSLLYSKHEMIRVN